MKTFTKITICIIAVVFGLFLEAKANCTTPVRYVSVSAGSFSSNNTWSPRGVPTACDTIIVNHALTLSGNFNLNLGSGRKGYLVINSTGSISSNNRGIFVSDTATFINHGSITVKNLEVNGPDAVFINNGSVLITTSATMRHTSVITNNSNMEFAALTLEGSSFTNNVGATVKVSGDFLQSFSAFYRKESEVFNNGKFNVQQGYSINRGQFYNYESGVLNVANSLSINSGQNNNMLSNRGVINVVQNVSVASNANINNFNNFNITGNLDITSSATVTNDDSLIVSTNLTNRGTMQGNGGYYIIYGVSENTSSGIAHQYIDICDKSSTNGGNFDKNNGTVGQYVTFCSTAIAPLPVVLLNFNGIRVNDRVLLNWRTGSEKDSKYFDIERSEDGKGFKTISRVAAAGNTSQLTEYQFEDNSLSKGTVYYRLHQVDIDGTSEYSKVISVSTESGSLTFEVYPNPVQREQVLSLDLHNLNSAIYVVEILDNTGRVIYKHQLQVKQPELQLEIPVAFESAPAGIYALRLIDTASNAVKVQKLVLQ